MRKSKCSPEQSVQAIRQVEAGPGVGDLCRNLGVTAATFCRLKKTYAGLDLHELRELRQWCDANQRLKQVVADLKMDKTILHDALGEKW
jgi:putative transposase